MTDPFVEWEMACEKVKCAVLEEKDFERQSRVAIEMAHNLVAVAHNLAGVACKACGGYGTRVYGSTATWRGGIGGQMLTDDVCDKCWGTGRTDKKGPDLRRIRQDTSEKIAMLERSNVTLLAELEKLKRSI